MTFIIDSPLLERMEPQYQQFYLRKWQKRAQQLKEEFGSQGGLYFEVEKLLLEIDPMGINYDVVDEYAGEARRIVKQLQRFDSIYDIKRTLEAVFQDSFEEIMPEDRSCYETMATSIAQLWPMEMEQLRAININLGIHTLVELGPKCDEGRLIEGVKIPWYEIARRLGRDPEFIYQIKWRELEEIIAGAYKQSGWPEVVLTPRARDGGRDIIASWPGLGAIRIVDQVKAYRKGRVVTADEVRSVIGVLSLDGNVSKGVISTTGEFAPSIRTDPKFRSLIPYRLELRSGKHLIRWLTQLT